MIFILCDSETINSYGFRTDVKGIDLSRFEKNPVMLYNHDPLKVIGKWEDVQVVEALTGHTVLTATPVFDKDDPFAAEIARKVEDGFIKGCSMGMMVVEMSRSKGIDTASKTILLEASIVSIPADENALVVYADKDRKQKLSINEFNKLYYSMENTEPTQAEIMLSDKNIELQAKIDEQSETIANLTATVDTLKRDIAEREYHDAELAVDEYVKKGVLKENVKSIALAFYLQNPEDAETLFSSLVPDEREEVSLSAMIKETRRGTSLQETTWDELDRKGGLAELKANNLGEFKRLYKEKFGKEYNA